MTPKQANAVYDVLVAAWAAQEQWRQDFVRSFASEDCREYRCGWGKFYRESDCWRVDVYSEDRAEQAARVAAVNCVLARMFAIHALLAECRKHFDADKVWNVGPYMVDKIDTLL